MIGRMFGIFEQTARIDKFLANGRRPVLKATWAVISVVINPGNSETTPVQGRHHHLCAPATVHITLQPGFIAWSAF